MTDRDSMLISSVLKRVAAEAPRRRELPDAHHFWITSQLMPNRAVQERVSRPMGVLQVLAYTVVAICWAGLITWKWPQIQNWVQGPDVTGRLLDAASGAASVSFSMVFLVGGLLAITRVVIMHSVLAEE